MTPLARFPFSRHRLIAFALVTGVAACQTPGSDADDSSRYRFPGLFTVTQRLLISKDGQTSEWRALAHREGASLEVTVVEPVFLGTVLQFRAEGQDVQVTQQSDSLPIPKAVLDRLAQSMSGLFQSAAPYSPGGDGATVTSHGARYTLEGIPASGNCRFPNVIGIAYDDPKAPRVRVETLEADCQP